MIWRAAVSLALSGLVEDVLKLAAGVVVAVLLSQAFALASLAALFGPALGGSSPAGSQLPALTAGEQAAFEAAAARCGLPWQVLAAIAAVGGEQSGPGSAGGPDQAADRLCASGGLHNLAGALRAVQPGGDAGWVDRVLATAARYGYVVPGTRDAQVVALARAQTGTPYRWGGARPEGGFDCSGLALWVYEHAGVRLPRTAQQQFDATQRIAPDELRPGDLVFFADTYYSPTERITHVGIYLGNGQMISAPRAGDVVREAAVFTGFWGAHYAGAGRAAEGG